ncbi:MAG TPA: hypothetical protein VN694_09150 [Caulobacteraceae bacterium]|nr:hypothetical protein [Caulobacteraceae bacterium]
MSPRLSPVEAALEGLRVVRREPWAVAYWIGVWAVALALIAIIRLATGALAPLHPSTDGLDAFRRFGPLALVLAPTLFVLWTMTTATVYRAVLRPGEHGWHLFKLGPDEARIAALSAVETLLLALLGGVPAYLLLVLLNPIFEVAPGFSRAIAIGGFVATILINAWLAVRLSLLPVQTFAARGFPVDAYWGFARGHYWKLLFSYVLVALEVFAFLAVALTAVAALGWLAETVIQWRGGGLTRNAALWALVVILALSFAILFVVPLILVCGCQSYAYRAIVDERAEPAGAPVAA